MSSILPRSSDICQAATCENNPQVFSLLPSRFLGYPSRYRETQEVTMNTETTPYPNREDFRKTRLGPNALVFTKIQGK